MPAVESLGARWKEDIRNSESLMERTISADLLQMRGAGGSQSPFVSKTQGEARESAEEVQAERSQRARTVDELYNAPTPDSFSQWANQPNRYDLPGVDTIPSGRLEERGMAFLERAQEAGAVDEVNLENRRLRTKKGRHQADRDPETSLEFESRIDTMPKEKLEEESGEFQSFAFGPVVAHETGHAADLFATGLDNPEFASDRLIGRYGDWELKEQAKALSERMRGDVSGSYREDPHELAADALASIAIEPRAARREAPDLVAALEENVLSELDRAVDRNETIDQIISS